MHTIAHETDGNKLPRLCEHITTCWAEYCADVPARIERLPNNALKAQIGANEWSSDNRSWEDCTRDLDYPMAISALAKCKPVEFELSRRPRAGRIVVRSGAVFVPSKLLTDRPDACFASQRPRWALGRRIITVGVNFGANCDIKVEQFVQAGALGLSVVDSLACAGYGVQLLGLWLTRGYRHDGTGEYAATVPIIGAGEYWDARRAVSRLAHPSALRVMGFLVMCESAAHYGGGLSSSLGKAYPVWPAWASVQPQVVIQPTALNIESVREQVARATTPPNKRRKAS